MSTSCTACITPVHVAAHDVVSADWMLLFGLFLLVLNRH